MFVWGFYRYEKAYDRVNRNKLFEVMRGYGVQENLVAVIERIYDGGMVKFELEGIMTGWCDAGMSPVSTTVDMYLAEKDGRVWW